MASPWLTQGLIYSVGTPHQSEILVPHGTEQNIDFFMLLSVAKLKFSELALEFPIILAKGGGG